MEFKKITPTYIIAKYFIEKDNLTKEDVEKIKDPNVKKIMEEVLENESR